MTANIPFNPTRLIQLSELPTREKEKYYNLLISANAKFCVDAEGRYVANVRLLAPGKKKCGEKKKKESQQSNSLMFEERLQRMHEQGYVSVRIEGVDPFDYNTFSRFAALISSKDEVVRPRSKLLSWLMRLIEEIYDARYAHEAAEIVREDTVPAEEKVTTIFPAYVVRRLSMRAGLRSLVDQHCWDLLYNTHVYRRDYLEVEVFARFLQEFYDHDDLLFFLYVRSVVSKLLHVSFKTRWAKNDGPGRQPRSLWMSYRECVSVAKTVFGAANELMCRDFIAIISPQLVGQKTESGDTRRIDITQFLHLAVVGYHQTRPSDTAGGHSNGSGMKLLPGEVVPMVPMPSPSGGAYMSKYSPYGVEEALPGILEEPIIDHEESDAYMYGDEISTANRYLNYGNPIEGIADDHIGLESSGVDAYLDEMQQHAGYSGYGRQFGDPDLIDIANTPVTLAHKDVPVELNSVYEEMSSVLMHREKEFLGFLCEPLEDLDEDVAEACIEALADELRFKLTDVLQNSSATSVIQFDKELLAVLGSQPFLADMEASRNLIIESKLQRA